MIQRLFLGILIAVWGLVATEISGQQRTTEPGDPIPDITAQEFEEFRLGLEDFLEVEEAAEGLGPAYNATSCAVCHSVPAIGGISPVSTMRAAFKDEDGKTRNLAPATDSLFHLFSIPNHSCQPTIPPEANIIDRRIPIPVFGAGLVEMIPDATILSLEDPFDSDGDGISGRAGMVIDIASGERRVGRFGWKSQQATLLSFGAEAYRNEMGITSDLFPTEVGFGLSAEQLRLCDPIPDPEDIREASTGRRGIDNFESFMQLLAPVERGPINEQERVGERVFSTIGCAQCHVPTLSTGAHSNPVFHRRSVPLFSDLLLHDVGTGDGIPQAGARPWEIRTPALWGLRFRRPLLHNGNAATIEHAILRHKKEARLAREGFEALGLADRAALLAFLNSL